MTKRGFFISMFFKVSKTLSSTVIHPVSVIFLYLKSSELNLAII
nr:MAG TPA: hypothetical protein [Caudoviricetes sp.]